MADLDPKELAQRNIPLIVIYVLALLPLPIWFVVVQGGLKEGKKDSVADALRKLKRPWSTTGPRDSSSTVPGAPAARSRSSTSAGESAPR